jgi:hypothetical protein
VTWLRALIAALALLSLALPCRADESEASLVLEAGPAFLNVQEPHDNPATTTVPGAGLTLGASYGVTDLLALDLAVGGALAPNAEYRDQPIPATPATRGNVIQDAACVRALVGFTLRFGARLIPTLGAHFGYQHHMLSNALLFNERDVALRALPDRSLDDLVATGSLGLDVRLNRHWLVGLAAQLSYGLGLSGNQLIAIEVPVRLTYSFYPGWFRSMRVARFED